MLRFAMSRKGTAMRTFILALMLINLSAGLRASAQQEIALRVLQPVTGEITDAQPEQRWVFDAARGQVLSARIQAMSGNLNPYMELIDATGKVLGTSAPTS